MVVGPQKNDAGYWTFWKVEGDAQHERLSTAERLCAGKKRAGWKDDWDRDDTSGVANLQPFS